MSSTRRDFLKASIGLGVGLAGCEAAPSLFGAPECARFDAPVSAEPSAVAAAFEVRDDGVILWARGAAPGAAVFELVSCRTGDVLREIPVGLGETLVGSAVVEGLDRDEPYYYRLVQDALSRSDWGWFRTAPAPSHPAPVHFAFSADVGLDPERETAIVEHMAESPAAFYMNLGDWPYADSDPGAQTLAEYRDRHASARRPAWIRNLLRRFPVYAIYDDHDIRCNWDEKWRLLEPERIEAGLTAWDEYFPLRGPSRYRSWRWGRHAEFFMLDTRLYRSANDAPDGPDKTMLGAAQKQWLLDGLRASDASFKLIVSSVPIGFATGNDHWSAFATERDEILGAIRADVGGAVFLTADRHYFAALHHGGGIREFHVGPLSAGPGNPPEPTPEVVGFANEINYGEVHIDDDPEPTLTLNARNRAGRILYSESFGP